MTGDTHGETASVGKRGGLSESNRRTGMRGMHNTKGTQGARKTEPVEIRLARQLALAKNCDDRTAFERRGGGRFMEHLAALVTELGGVCDYQAIKDLNGRLVGHQITIETEDSEGDVSRKVVRLDLRRWDLIADGAADPFKVGLQATNKSLTGLMRLFEAAMVRAIAGKPDWLVEAYREIGLDPDEEDPEIGLRVAGWIAHGLIKLALENTVAPERRAHLRTLMEYSPGVRQGLCHLLRTDIDTDVLRDWAIAAPAAVALKRRLALSMATHEPSYPLKAFLKAAKLTQSIGRFRPGVCGTIQRAFGLTGVAGDQFELSSKEGGFFTPAICASAPANLHQQRFFLPIMIRLWEVRGLKFAEAHASLVGNACAGWVKGKIAQGEIQYIADFLAAEDEHLAAAKLKRPGKGSSLKGMLESARRYASYERALRDKGGEFRLREDFPDDGILPGTRAKITRLKSASEIYDAWIHFQNCSRDYVDACRSGDSALYVLTYDTTGDEVKYLAMLEVRRTGNGLLKRVQCLAPFNAAAPPHIDKASYALVDSINRDIIARQSASKSAA